MVRSWLCGLHPCLRTCVPVIFAAISKLRNGPRAQPAIAARHATGPMPSPGLTAYHAHHGGEAPLRWEDEMPMRESRLRIGVLGAGAWAARAHVPGWLRDPRCEVVAIADVELDRAQALCEAMGVGGA